MPQSPVTFPTFGGLRLDLALDEAGADNAIYLRDVDWDGSTGKLRSRDGFQKLKAADASGPYKGLFAHSSTRLLATKRVGSEVKIVAVDREGAEKVEAAWTSTAAKSCFTRYGIPSASYTYGRAAASGHKVVRFDGTNFTEPTAKVGAEAGKEMPRGAIMLTWPDAGNVLVTANTAAEGGPNKLASSNSHVWFSMPASAEEYETTAYVQLSPGDGEEIVAGAVFGGQVFLFKETKFFVFSVPGTDEEGKPIYGSAFREVTLGEGSRMKRASAEALAETSDQLATATADGVYFCTTDGIYWTTGGQPTKISQALTPLEETTPFDGPMADFLNGSTETFRWPAAGIVSIGRRLIVKRYEFLFIYDIPTDAWTCWKMPTVSLAVWTGLTGGGSEVSEKPPGTVTNDATLGTVEWVNTPNAKAQDGSYATAALPVSAQSKYLKATNFGFEIPAEATILGIAVSPRRKRTGNGVIETLHLVKGGAIQAYSRGSFPEVWSTLVGTKTYGGNGDLWENTWVPADFGANFGVVLLAEWYPLSGEVEAAKAELDAIKISIFFSLPEVSGGVRPRLFVTSAKAVFWTGTNAEEQAGTRDPAYECGFYDLDSDDEKDLVTMKVWGSGTVDVAVAKDFGEPGKPTTVELGDAPEIIAKEFNKSATGTVHSHRISGDAPWSIQRLTRWLREGRAATTKTR
jgi:hypothetical protein